MAEFHLDFVANLSSISASGCRLSVERVTPASPVSPPDFTAQAMATLSAVEEKLASLDSSFNEQANSFREHAAGLAIEIARAVLNDETLMMKRVEQFVEAALNQCPSNLRKTVFVHPDCLELITDWMEKSETTIDIADDPTLSPGDCRVEMGDVGMVATLDAYMDAVMQRLAQAGSVHTT